MGAMDGMGGEGGRIGPAGGNPPLPRLASWGGWGLQSSGGPVRATAPMVRSYRPGVQNVSTLSMLTYMPWPVRLLVKRVPSVVAAMIQP